MVDRGVTESSVSADPARFLVGSVAMAFLPNACCCGFGFEDVEVEVLAEVEVFAGGAVAGVPDQDVW